MTHIYIVRHAEVIYPLDEQGRKLMYPPETPISQEGIKQFTAFARQLKQKRIKLDAIVTSLFTRATQTAQILTDVLGVKEYKEEPAFSDSYVPGWIGIPLSEQQRLMDQGTDIYENPRSSDQEPYKHIAARMFRGYRGLVNRYPGKSVALVSHGDPIRLLMHRINYPEGQIPNMSILSKEGYLKRGEVLRVEADESGKVLETELMTNLEGRVGERESYIDKPPVK